MTLSTTNRQRLALALATVLLTFPGGSATARAEIRTTRRARIRDLREKVELANLKRVLAYQRACSKADRSGLARPAYPELLTIDSVRPPAPVPQTNRDPSAGSLMPMVAAVLASGVARMVADSATRRVDGPLHPSPR